MYAHIVYDLKITPATDLSVYFIDHQSSIIIRYHCCFLDRSNDVRAPLYKQVSSATVRKVDRKVTGQIGQGAAYCLLGVGSPMAKVDAEFMAEKTFYNMRIIARDDTGKMNTNVQDVQRPRFIGQQFHASRRLPQGSKTRI